MKFQCKKCGSDNVFIQPKGHHTGLYCRSCGSWIQWLSKDKIRMAEKQIADIKQSTIDHLKHGKWVMRGGKLFCSECGKKACVARDSDDFWYTKGTYFCPNCGTKMDGDKNV